MKIKVSDWLLPTVLSTTAGAVDVIGFLTLGGLFTAHITGNVVIVAAHYVTGGFSQIGPLLAVPVFMAVLALVTLASGAIARAGSPPLRPLLLLQAILLAGFLGLGGEVMSEALGVLALGGSLTTLGYSASRKTTIDVTNLIVPQASIRGLNMFAQPKASIGAAWEVIVSLLKSDAIKPIVAKTFPLTEAVDALRYLIEGRPFGRVVLTI